MSAMSRFEPTLPVQIDPFIQLGNLAAFMLHLDRALAKAMETDAPLAILQLDLDAFAQLNDVHGRETGDETIVRVATALRAISARQGLEQAAPTLAFRIGGDEFALVLPGADRAAAQAVAEEIIAHDALTGIALSIGVAVAEPGTLDLGTILLAAAEGLRQAKERGGACFVVQPPAVPPTEASALIGQLARQLATTQRHLEEAYQLALTDPVTSLPNQRALHRFLEAEVPRAIRHRHALALLLVDGDNLKAYNERLGYAGGDKWIRALGELLARTTRASDLTARWRSGDEFIIALPETTRAAAGLLAERIRMAVERLSDQLPMPVTVSIGVAAFPDDATTIEGLLNRVEKANGLAKSLGKNQVVMTSLGHAEAEVV